MKKLILLVAAINFFSAMPLAGISLGSDELGVPFIAHTEPGPFGSYLARNLIVDKYAQLAGEISQNNGQLLKTRGEAHITVITPIEFFNVLKPFVSIEEINRIALDSGIQNIAFEEVCLGRGTKELAGVNQATYFIVVTSPGLIELREKIATAFIAVGGSPSAFDPYAFYPHITIGYTDRDLHLEDGVVKDKTSCLAMTPPTSN